MGWGAENYPHKKLKSWWNPNYYYKTNENSYISFSVYKENKNVYKIHNLIINYWTQDL